MLSCSGFWQAVDEQGGPGVLRVAVLSSWKWVADTYGMVASGIVAGVFGEVCGQAASSALLRCRVSTIGYAAYWPEPGGGRDFVEGIQRWTPMELVTPSMTLPIRIDLITVERGPGEGGEDCYRNALAATAAAMAALPPEQRHPVLSGTWQQAIGA